MARIRSTHPEQWTDEHFVTMSPLARLLTIAVRNEADDNGVFECNVAKLKIRLLPMDHCDIGDLVREMFNAKQIISFSLGGREFAVIRNFRRYQRPKKAVCKHPFPGTLPDGTPFATYIGDAPIGEPAAPETDRVRHQSVTGWEPVPYQFGNPPAVVEDLGEKGITPTESVPLDENRSLWSEGVELLTTSGVSERQARSLIGKWRKDHGATAVLQAIQSARTHAAADPVEFIIGALRAKRQTPPAPAYDDPCRGAI